jgi:PilZ domain
MPGGAAASPQLQGSSRPAEIKGMATEPLVLPVRFTLGTQAVQGSTRALTLEAAFIRSLSPPKAGQPLSLRVYWNGGAADDFSCVVDARPGPLGEIGFWARFVSLTPQGRERIKAALASATRQQAGRAIPQMIRPDLRAQTRYPVRLRTRVRTAMGPRLEFSVNISASGMFLASESPPALREVVALSIDLPGESAPLEVKAEVMHIVLPAQGNPGNPAGYGVQFVYADDRFRERLDGLLGIRR